jgi:cytochrome c553
MFGELTNMNTHQLTSLCKLLSIGIIFTVSACSSPDRSRDLNNASIPISTTALQVCSNCHGVQGVSTSPNFPNLAAQSQSYLVKQLTGFKNHGRSDPEGFEYMWGLSSHLTDEQITGLATYFSTLPAPKGNVDNAGTATQLTEGKQIVEQGIPTEGIPACIACHGDHAQGNDIFPRLAGQHADYLFKQLTVFRETDQRPDAAAMKAVAHNLTTDNIKSVAAYLETMSTSY